MAKQQLSYGRISGTLQLDAEEGFAFKVVWVMEDKKENKEPLRSALFDLPLCGGLWNLGRDEEQFVYLTNYELEPLSGGSPPPSGYERE